MLEFGNRVDSLMYRFRQGFVFGLKPGEAQGIAPQGVGKAIHVAGLLLAGQQAGSQPDDGFSQCLPFRALTSRATFERQPPQGSDQFRSGQTKLSNLPDGFFG